MNHKPTVTIGIPAYNEEANIGKLIKALLTSEQKNFILKEIIVVSDASTDSTIEAILKVSSKKVKLLKNSTRIGQALAQNIIFKNFNSDYIVLINADVLPENGKTIDNLIKEFTSEDIGIVGGRVLPIKPTNYFQSILKYSVNLKEQIYIKISNGNNIYLCHGRIRAFSKKFAKVLNWGPVAAEDAFSYLKCVSNGFKFKYCPEAAVYYNLPRNLKDHVKQSARFFGTRNNLSNYFYRKLVEKSYYLPLDHVFLALIKNLILNPVLFISYGCVILYCWVKGLLKVNASHVWSVSTTTKILK